MDHGQEDHGGGGCCGGGGHGHGHHGVVAGLGEELVTCAVRGTAQVKSQAEVSGLMRHFEGERYYFCCGHCAELFDANPHAYTTAA